MARRSVDDLRSLQSYRKAQLGGKGNSEEGRERNFGWDVKAEK